MQSTFLIYSGRVKLSTQEMKGGNRYLFGGSYCMGTWVNIGNASLGFGCYTKINKRLLRDLRNYSTGSDILYKRGNSVYPSYFNISDFSDLF